MPRHQTTLVGTIYIYYYFYLVDPVGHLSHNYRPPPTQTNHANHSTSQQMNTPSQKKHGEERIGKRKSVSHKILGIRNLDQ